MPILKRLLAGRIPDAQPLVGRFVQENLQSKGPLEALEMALAHSRSNLDQLIHHSDRATQYCSNEYTRLLKKNEISISMTRDGDPGENAGPDADIVCWSIAERINGTIKNEFYCCGFLSFPLAQKVSQKLSMPTISCVLMLVVIT
jgi:hypothetical protein